MKQVDKGYLITHTHWDREWRYPLWENRKYLVDMIDELLEHLEANQDYTAFLLDGQVVPVFDYLEVRPNEKERLFSLIRQGRIQVGPWYTLPDLYPISGESLVRNLQAGFELCKQHQLPWLDIGYESFGWGQPSQFPQIYKGFGIETIIVSKNVDKERAPDCEFLWQGKDGTTVLASRLGTDARANFFMNTYLEAVTGKKYKSKDYVYDMEQMGQVYHQADAAGGYHQDYFRLEDTQTLDSSLVKDAFLTSWHNMDDSLLPNHRLLMSGSDSTTCQTYITDIIQQINTDYPDIEVKHSDLKTYVQHMRDLLDFSTLRTLTGELRDGPSTSLSANALMTRPHIKQLGQQVEQRLYGAAEPFSVVSSLLGERYEQEFLALAKDYLLLSHPHDSINGVTQDKTVADVLFHLTQGYELADVVYHTACKAILRHIDTSSVKEDDVLLVAFNPLPFPRREVLHAMIDTPKERNVWEFTMEDMDGTPLETHHLGRNTETIPVSDMHARPWPFYADRHEILFDSGEIPAGGYRMYRIGSLQTFDRKTEFWATTRTTKGQELASSPTRMENEFLAVDVNPNGTVSLLDKQTNRQYDNLNYYESTGDVGDYWMYYPPYDNQTFSSKGLSCQTWLEENTPLQATIVTKIELELPAHGYRPEKYHKGESRRSKHFVTVPITTRYTLKKGEEQLHVAVALDNRAKDHRMSVLFDTGIQTDYVAAEGHFCVDHRPRQPRKDSQGAYYNEMMTQPMQRFVALEDGKAGFAVLNQGMCEYEAKNGSEGTLSLTLFRAVRNIICTEWRSASEFPNQLGGQLQQVLEYRYTIAPYQGDWEKEELLSKARQLNQPVTLAQTAKARHSTGTLPTSTSFYSIGTKLQLSALKKKEKGEGFVLRLYNPYETSLTEKITLGTEIKQAWLLNLKEERLQEIFPQNGALLLTVSPDKIITLEVVVE